MKDQFQLELFKTQQYQPDRSKKAGYRPNFFRLLRAREKTISVIIMLFIASLISFSLGVEKGKRSIVQAQPREFQQIVLADHQIEKQSKDTKDIKDTKDTKDTKDIKDISKYTIQVATFKTQAYAKKEADRLERKGLEALIIPRGEYISVCVGNFSEKNEAKLTQEQLKKTYQDCFIRRL